MAKAKEAAKDWGGLLTGIAAIAGVLVTYMQSMDRERDAIEDISRQEAKLEKAYEVLTEAVKHIAARGDYRDGVIGDLREAIGELRGGFTQLDREVGGILDDSDAIDRILADHEDHGHQADVIPESGHRTPLSSIQPPEPQRARPPRAKMKLPTQLPVPDADHVERKIRSRMERMEAK